ncbi:MAG TPA: amidohydrolase family protein [Candidatus Sulfotelmatobacter sp.]|nr:amidohydrolase family protein [Candidatus Sulfotelmatobacter sp.]
MDSSGTVLHNSSILVRNGVIVAIWQGREAPPGVPLGNAIGVDLGPEAMVFPGLINLHNHPTYDVLDPWPAPSSDVQTTLGRPLGTEPYANRYQWNDVPSTSPPEYRRLVDTPQLLLNSGAGLGLLSEVVKYSEVKAMLGGETAFQDGSPDPATDNLMIRNVQSTNFGRQAVFSRVPSIDQLSSGDLVALITGMQNGQVDAWLTHLAEGVRDSQRRAGDTFSSRAEFTSLQSLGLLTDMTVVVQGNGLEEADFAAMRAAPSIRLNHSGDGLGAKLVWSPLSNLLLYGQTALIYHALKEGVTISLGTDWSPSGSRNLLDELKVADIALRDPRLLGLDRDLVPSLSVDGKTGEARKDAEIALDHVLVEMVTRNPAQTLRWNRYVGSIEAGKFADLIVIGKSDRASAKGIPDSPYRSLIDATEEDVRLVLVNGEPRSGDVEIMAALKPGNYEVIRSACANFSKGIDTTNPALPKGTETFAYLKQTLIAALSALGGDNPPPGGGTADDSNTYSYLKANIPGAAGLTDAQFRYELTLFAGLDPRGRLNLEGIQLSPALVEDDHFYFHLLEGDLAEGTGLISDTSPPFGLYPTNLNQIQAHGNPFGAEEYGERYSESCH